jgi:dihydrofolate synthase/folylpolyglutamate synthase
MSDDNTPAEDPVAEAEELLAAVEDRQTEEEARPGTAARTGRR